MSERRRRKMRKLWFAEPPDNNERIYCETARAARLEKARMATEMYSHQIAAWGDDETIRNCPTREGCQEEVVVREFEFDPRRPGLVRLLNEVRCGTH